MSNPHADGTDNYKSIIDKNGQPIYVPSSTDANNTDSNNSRISKKYKRQTTVTLKPFNIYIILLSTQSTEQCPS